MDLNRKQQLEIAGLERDLKQTEEVLKKGYLRFITPRVLLFMVIFTPLFALIQRSEEQHGTTFTDWLWYILAGFITGYLGATAEFFIWRRTRNKYTKLLEKKREPLPK